MVIIITMKIINNKTMYMKCKIDMAMLLNTFTANDELSCSPGFLYFCQLRDNSYFRDPLFLPATSYLVVPGSFNFVNYEITCTTLFLIFHLFTQKQMDFIIFVGKLKTQRILLRAFQTFSVLPCYEISRSTEYGLIEISVINS